MAGVGKAIKQAEIPLYRTLQCKAKSNRQPKQKTYDGKPNYEPDKVTIVSGNDPGRISAEEEAKRVCDEDFMRVMLKYQEAAAAAKEPPKPPAVVPNAAQEDSTKPPTVVGRKKKALAPIPQEEEIERFLKSSSHPAIGPSSASCTMPVSGLPRLGFSRSAIISRGRTASW